MKKKELKKIKLLGIFLIFLLSFPTHFIYKLFPNILISFFFPVNESIFEHLKIIFTSTLLYGIIDYLLLKRKKIIFNNFPLQLFLTSFLSIFIFLTIYLPLYYLIGEYLPLTLLLLFLTYVISQILSYYLLILPKIPYLNTLAIPFIILVYINFIILTYSPPHQDLFRDPTTNLYGIEKDQISP